MAKCGVIGFGFARIDTTCRLRGGFSASVEVPRDDLTTQGDLGAGFQSLHSATDPGLARDAGIDPFLLQPDGYASALAGAFDNLSITAGQFVSGSTPEPATALLLLASPGAAARRRRG